MFNGHSDGWTWTNMYKHGRKSFRFIVVNVILLQSKKEIWLARNLGANEQPTTKMLMKKKQLLQKIVKSIR